MAIRILHTSDWHLGQTFHEYDRSIEHQKFLEWLTETICLHQIDLLLISGDIFDVANPSSAATALYFNFLRVVSQRRAGLQIIIIAGNHDSPARLEAPKELLKAFNITVVGMIECNEQRLIDYEKLMVPLYNRLGNRVGLCLAVPFVRPGDYPISGVSYEQGIANIYDELYTVAQDKKLPGEFIIAMGHLHTLGAVASVDDKSERLIMGGLEFIPSTAFNPGITYTALGHIHKAQCIDSVRNVMYAGSPIPMSFSEINYKHKVFIIDIETEFNPVITTVEIPVTTGMMRIPLKPLPLKDVLPLLEALPEAQPNMHEAPYLEVKVLLTEPEPTLKTTIETALKEKFVRLARISVSYPANDSKDEAEITGDELDTISPLDIFKRRYTEIYNEDIPVDLVRLFNEIQETVNQPEVVL